MDICCQLELVVDHGKAPAVRLQPQILRIFGERQRNAILELAGIHGMSEPHRRYELLQIRVARILVEPALRDLRGKRLAAKVEAVIFQADTGGEEPLAVEGHRELAVNRPIVLGSELEILIAQPYPGAGEMGRELNAADRLVYLLERRGGLAELDREGLDRGDPPLAVFSKSGSFDRVGDIVRHRPSYVPEPASQHRRQNGEANRHSSSVRGDVTRAGCHPAADRPHPRRRVPGHLSHHSAHQPCDPVCDFAGYAD